MTDLFSELVISLTVARLITILLYWNDGEEDRERGGNETCNAILKKTRSRSKAHLDAHSPLTWIVIRVIDITFGPN